MKKEITHLSYDEKKQLDRVEAKFGELLAAHLAFEKVFLSKDYVPVLDGDFWWEYYGKVSLGLMGMKKVIYTSMLDTMQNSMVIYPENYTDEEHKIHETGYVRKKRRKRKI